jgi:hypothetical protein
MITKEPVTMPAQPRPWIARPMIRTVQSGARPHTKDPSSKTLRATRYEILTWKRHEDPTVERLERSRGEEICATILANVVVGAELGRLCGRLPGECQYRKDDCRRRAKRVPC